MIDIPIPHKDLCVFVGEGGGVVESPCPCLYFSHILRVHTKHLEQDTTKACRVSATTKKRRSLSIRQFYMKTMKN